eukprot:CAMPEP_0178910528 /NCGR_PEP_ID=MMETSP0786-20121207/9146_1 /TAXON_ID=186022 /ORGANISM="Thalassionema frauenfeldii, Strain CCMP 1798" /LENGTH=491 /DNA_ID=CAMNT_0020582787 /DNA_START=45 /DNA_END=1517 /DNA_ORIENTATION=+
MAKDFILSLRQLSLKSDCKSKPASEQGVSTNGLAAGRDCENEIKIIPNEGEYNKTWKQYIAMPRVMLGKRQRLDHESTSTKKKKGTNKFRSTMPPLEKQKERIENPFATSSIPDKEDNEKPTFLPTTNNFVTATVNFEVRSNYKDATVAPDISFYNRSFYNSPFYKKSTAKIFQVKSSDPDTISRVYSSSFYNSSTCEIFRTKNVALNSSISQKNELLRKNPFENQSRILESEALRADNGDSTTDCSQIRETKLKNCFEKQNGGSENATFPTSNAEQRNGFDHSMENIPRPPFGSHHVAMPKEIVLPQRDFTEEAKEQKQTNRHHTTNKRKKKKKKNHFLILVSEMEWKFSSRKGVYTGEAYASQGESIAHGRGKLRFSNGDTYEGRFKHGEMHGEKAIFKSSTGFEYNGSYKHNARNGFGEQTHLSGRRYMGNFVNDLPDGFGVQYNADGSMLYCGKWKSGIPFPIKQEECSGPSIAPLTPMPRTNDMSW